MALRRRSGQVLPHHNRRNRCPHSTTQMGSLLDVALFDIPCSFRWRISYGSVVVYRQGMTLHHLAPVFTWHHLRPWFSMRTFSSRETNRRRRRALFTPEELGLKLAKAKQILQDVPNEMVTGQAAVTVRRAAETRERLRMVPSVSRECARSPFRFGELFSAAYPARPSHAQGAHAPRSTGTGRPRYFPWPGRRNASRS